MNDLKNDIKNTRALLSFNQLINLKYESVLKSGWIKKINSKGGFDSRFFVATSAAFYLCKQSGLGRTVKIHVVHAIVDLERFEIGNDNTISLLFPDSKITFILPDSKFMYPVYEYLINFLPPSHQSYSSIPCQSTKAKRHIPEFQFLSLFVSALKSLKTDLNEYLYNSFHQTLKHSNSVQIIQTNNTYSLEILQAFCKALSLVDSISLVSIGGSNFPDLFQSLAFVLRSHSHFECLNIVDYSNNNGFVQFLRAVNQFSLHELCFTSVNFRPQMIQALTTNLPTDSNTTKLRKITFSSIDFDKDNFSPLLQHPESFSVVNELEISKTIHPLKSDTLSSIISFTCFAKLHSLSLKDCGIDIASVFSLFDQFQSLSLSFLDLSNNKCGPSLKPNQRLLSSIRILQLNDITWDTSSYVSFFTFLSPNNSGILCDLSNTKISDISKDPFLSMNSTQCPITSLILRNCKITIGFINLISSFPHLEELDLAKSIPYIFGNKDAEGLLVAMSRMLECLPLKKLYLTSFFKNSIFDNLKMNFLAYISKSLITSQCLQKLIMDDNKIGDEGLPILRNIIIGSKSLIEVSFDDSELISPNSLIDFLEKIADAMENNPSIKLKILNKPNNEMKKFCSMSSAIKKSVLSAWSNVMAIIDKKGVPSDNDSSFQKLIETSSIKNVSKTPIKTKTSSEPSFFPPTEKKEASWDVVIDIGLKDNENNWQALREEYSIRNLIGNNILKKDSDDLIDL